MTIVPHVCAEFHDRDGTVLYRIKPNQLRAIIVDAPESIRQDPLFDMLVSDRSLEVVTDRQQLKRLENDPEPKARETAEDTGSAAPAEETKTSGRKSAEKK